MTAAIQPLLLARNCEEDDSAGELLLAQYPGALQHHGRAAAIVIGTGSEGFRILIVGGARIVVSDHEVDPSGIGRIGAFQYRIDIDDLGRLRNAPDRAFGETIGFHLQAAATGIRIALEFGPNPLAGSAYAPAWRRWRWGLQARWSGGCGN